MSARVYRDADIDLGILKCKKVAIVGYGNQGRAQALNLRDSGLDVIVSNRKGSENYEKAIGDSFNPLTAAEATKLADVIQILTPDETMSQVYQDEIGPNLSAGKALMFSHGFNIHFNQIVPPADVDVVLVAPKGVGRMVRRVYEEGNGLPALFAIHQDATGHAKETALAYAKGIGAGRSGVIETTFKEETEADLFGEQAVLCGGATALVTAGFETLVEAGYQPEVAYFECVHELKLIVDLIYEGGIDYMRRCISNTAEYGGYTVGPKIINEHTKEVMRHVLAQIQTGEFAKEWILENQSNQPTLNAARMHSKEHLIEEVGKELRALMPWLGRK